MAHATITNNGNPITRRAFTDDLGVHPDRGRALVRTTNKARATCYQYTEDLPPNGSGLPSPLHVVCEQIRELDALCREQACPLDCAREVADYPAQFLAQLRSAAPRAGDAVARMNLLMKTAADANFLLKGRRLEDLAAGEQKEFSQLAMSAATYARELAQVADDLVARYEAAHEGVPWRRERAGATG